MIILFLYFQIAELDEKLADLQSEKVQHVVFSENSKDAVVRKLIYW